MIGRVLRLERADDLREFAASLRPRHRGLSKREWAATHVLGAQITKVSILEQTVLIVVHVGEDEHDCVALHPHLQLVKHVGEVGEGHVAPCLYVERPESRGHLPEFLDDPLR